MVGPGYYEPAMPFGGPEPFMYGMPLAPGFESAPPPPPPPPPSPAMGNGKEVGKEDLSVIPPPAAAVKDPKRPKVIPSHSYPHS